MFIVKHSNGRYLAKAWLGMDWARNFTHAKIFTSMLEASEHPVARRGRPTIIPYNQERATLDSVERR